MHVLRFWGKARPLAPDRGPKWHPLAFHSLDVAAVGKALLAARGGPGSGLPPLLGLHRDDASSLVCFLLSLHDVGKFAMKFQAKAPGLYPDCFGNDPARLSAHYDHGAGGLRLFDAAPEAFRLPNEVGVRAWRPLISAVTGHHGSPPEPGPRTSLAGLRSDFGHAGIEAAHDFIRQAHELFDVPPRLPALDRKRAMRASHALAGLAVLADWIGSNQDWFPYREPEQDLVTYWRDARERAARAAVAAGMLPARASGHLEYHDLIGAGTPPSPMQEWARTVGLPTGPALFLIEDETGSGKTEAALMLAHRLIESRRADGLYVALPTMATANAMFDRLAAACRHLFSARDQPSIALAHGARELHEGFRAAMTSGGRVEAPYSEADEPEGGSETTASAACAAWIADDRRRSFLADAGAGTIDQALLAVLPSRHQSLRLLGLMRRVLILDEVHAYDAYMQREMERLLEFQAGLGGSAVLLSATLPQLIRQRLADAFAKGLGREIRGNTPVAMDYPMATVCAAESRHSTKIAGQSGRARILPVGFLWSADEALREVERTAGAGKAVLYIRNTVDDALDAHAALRDGVLDPDLFHARFALIDRLEIEKRVVRTFGKDSTSPERAGRVLIATQVVEQSLDLDFDVLITDLAPIDLLIQRAGRLWRHHRPEREGCPELYVVGPKPVAGADAEWFRRTFPRAAHVYKDHARLWLTAKVLADAGGIESPGGLRGLVERVYGKDVEACIPDDLKGNFFDAEGRGGADRGLATASALDFAGGYVRDGGAWESDVRAPTRLDEVPRVTLRLARVRDGRIEPYARSASPEEAWRAWRLSEVSVSAHRVGGEAVPPQYAEAARAVRTDWTRFDSDKVLVVLDEAHGGSPPLRGAAASSGEASGQVLLWYDPGRGLTWGELQA